MATSALTSVKAAIARSLVATHSWQAKVIARLPRSVRTFLRSTLAFLAALRPGRRVDEWGHSRQQLAIDGWDHGLIAGAPADGDVFGVPEPLADASPAATVVTRAESSTADSEAPRCVFVTSVLDVGGVGEVVAFLASRLREYGIRPAVLNPVPNPSADGIPSGRLAQRLLADGLEVVEVDEASGRVWLDRWQPEVINAHGAPGWLLDYAVDNAVPYVDTLHGMHSFFGIDWAAEAERAQGITRFIAVSETVRQQYLAGNPSFSPERVVAIPNAVDERRFAPANREQFRSALGLSEEYVFVCLARHCLQKNTYGLVAGFAELARTHPNVHLVVAGRIDDDRYYRHVRRLHDSLPSKDRIHIRDHLAEPRKLLAASDGFVLDSFFEGWSLASMEALFAGVPVVISDVGGAKEQVDNDPNRGYVVQNPLGDPIEVSWDTIGPIRFAQQVNRDELVDAMARLVANRDSLLERRASLAAESAARFDTATCLRRQASVLREAAREGSSSPVR